MVERLSAFFITHFKKEDLVIYQVHKDLLERKRQLKWTNRECGNAIGCPPGVASSKLNGFLILTDEERRRLEKGMTEAEKAKIEMP
jgi:hypothetical protein